MSRTPHPPATQHARLGRICPLDTAGPRGEESPPTPPFRSERTPSMRRSGFLAAVAASAALATALTGGPAGAATTRPHFTKLTGVTLAPGFTPLSLDKGKVTVSVTLSTPSVTRQE